MGNSMPLLFQRHFGFPHAFQHYRLRVSVKFAHSRPSCQRYGRVGCSVWGIRLLNRVRENTNFGIAGVRVVIHAVETEGRLSV